MEKLLQAGLTAKAITKRSFEMIIVETTLQPKAVQFPTDAWLYRNVNDAMLRIMEKEGLTPEKLRR